MSAALLSVAAAGGWLIALGAASTLLRLRRRLERVARAEHELRGPAAVLLLACERMRREPSARRHVRALEVELERLVAGLADLTAARTGSEPRPVARVARGPADLRSFARGALAGWSPALAAAGREARIDWRAGSVPLPPDRGRVAQALGNLVANAAEHGAGPVELRGERVRGGVRVEVSNELRESGGARTNVNKGQNTPHPTALFGPDRERGRGTALAADAARRLGGTLTLPPSPGRFVAALELPLEESDGRGGERPSGRVDGDGDGERPSGGLDGDGGGERPSGGLDGGGGGERLDGDWGGERLDGGGGGERPSGGLDGGAGERRRAA